MARCLLAAGAFLALFLTGCSGFISLSGPTNEAIYNEAESVSAPSSPPLGYTIIQVEPRLFPTLSYDEEAFFEFSSHRPAADVRPGVGDLLSITIFESGPGGMFSSEAARAGSSTELPSQTVDANGEITFPFVGKIRVAGRSLASIQHDIEEKIRNRAIEPQVIVNIREQRANQISVLGQVNASGTLPLPPGGLRILQAIARSGGLRNPGYETIVTLRRDGRIQTVPFDQIIANGKSNIFLTSGDVLYVSREPRTFLALGAFGGAEVNGRIEFETQSLTLMDAIGKARGLADARANPGAAFVFRFEKSEVLRRLGYPIDDQAGQFVPTIYRVDLSRPASFFLASQFRVRNKDVLYVANATTVDLTKFFTFIGNVSQPILQGAATAGIINGIVTGTGGAIAAPVATTPTR